MSSSAAGDCVPLSRKSTANPAALKTDSQVFWLFLKDYIYWQSNTSTKPSFSFKRLLLGFSKHLFLTVLHMYLQKCNFQRHKMLGGEYLNESHTNYLRFAASDLLATVSNLTLKIVLFCVWWDGVIISARNVNSSGLPEGDVIRTSVWLASADCSSCEHTKTLGSSVSSPLFRAQPCMFHVLSNADMFMKQSRT